MFPELSGDVRLVAARVGASGLTGMTRFGFDRADHLVPRCALGDPPLTGPVSGFDVLAGRCRPRDVRIGLIPDGLPHDLTETLQGLEDYHHGDHIALHRRTTPLPREQVGEHLIGEQPQSMLGEHRVHPALGPPHARTAPQLRAAHDQDATNLSSRSLFDPR